MVQKSYRSELTSRKYVKIYSKKVTTLLNAKFMNQIISAKDITSARMIVYEKRSDSNLMIASCILQFVTLTSGIKLRYMTFKLHKRVEIDDYAFKREVATLLNEQYDLADIFDDQYSFIKL